MSSTRTATACSTPAAISAPARSAMAAPRWRRRIADQVKELEFIALDAGISHIYVAELAERLSEIVICDEPVFSFTNSGSESNELAFKIARTFHARRGEPSRTKIISRLGSYHGSSIAASAATGVAAFRTGFGPLAPDFLQTEPPTRDAVRPPRAVVDGRALPPGARSADRARGTGDDRRGDRRAGRDPRRGEDPAFGLLQGPPQDLRRPRHPAHHRRGGLRFRPDREDVRRRAFRRDRATSSPTPRA